MVSTSIWHISVTIIANYLRFVYVHLNFVINVSWPVLWWLTYYLRLSMNFNHIISRRFSCLVRREFYVSRAWRIWNHFAAILIDQFGILFLLFISFNPLKQIAKLQIDRTLIKARFYRFIRCNSTLGQWSLDPSYACLWGIRSIPFSNPFWIFNETTHIVLNSKRITFFSLNLSEFNLVVIKSFFIPVSHCYIGFKIFGTSHEFIFMSVI